jgi:predicted ATPase
MLSTAYDAAVDYLRRGVELLGEGPWLNDYALCRSLHVERFVAEYLAGRRELALEQFADVLPRLTNDEDRTELYISKIGLETGDGHSVEALDAAIEGLEHFGVKLTRDATQSTVLREYAALRWQQGRREIADLYNLPELNNPKKRHAMRLLMAMAPPAFFVNSRLLAVVLTRTARLSLKYGLCDASAYGFTGFGTVLSGVFDKYEAAYEFGQLGLRVNERYPNDRFRCKLLFQAGTYLTPWVRPFTEGIALIRKAIEIAQQSGDAIYEAYAAGTLSVITYCEAAHLKGVQETAEASREITMRRRDRDMSALVDMHARYCAALRGLSGDLKTLGDAALDDERLRASLSAKQTPVGLFYYCLCSAQLAYLHDDFERAQSLLTQAAERRAAIFSIPTTVEHCLWQLLVTAREYERSSRVERIKLGRSMRAALKSLSRWAALCPRNFAAHYKLGLAEYARIHGAAKTAQCFDDAIQVAREHQSLKWEALALELYAKVLRDCKEPEQSRARLREAAEAYARWGADGRAKELLATDS